MARQFLGGSTSYLSAGDVTDFRLDMTGADVAVISAWVFPTSSGADHTLVGKWDSTVAGVQYGLGISSTLVPYFQWSDGTTLNSMSAGGAIPLNTWTHLLAHNAHNTWNSPRMWVNGANTGTGSRTVNMHDTASHLILGVRHGGTLPLIGFLADAAIWRYPSTDQAQFVATWGGDQINAIAKGMPIQAHPANPYLVAHWPLWGVLGDAGDHDLSGKNLAPLTRGPASVPVGAFGRRYVL